MIKNQEKITSFACVSGKADGMYPILALIDKERTLAGCLVKRRILQEKSVIKRFWIN